MISDAALDDLRARNPVTAIAGKWVSLRERRGSKPGWLVGPCPLHSTDPFAKDSTSFECDAERWVCVVCGDGGDVIKLVEKREGLSFRKAVAWLGGTQEIDPEEQKRRDAEAAKKKARNEAAAAKFREDERERCWAYWNEAMPADHTTVEQYLTGPRGLPPESPPILWGRLRFHPRMPYYGPRTTHLRADGSRGRDYPNLLHTGPAMLAPILGPDGRFAGLHITWLDMADAKGKLCLADPATGEILPAKKVRGSMGGGRIELIRLPAPRRLVIGEGIETVLSVACALLALGRAEGVAFWSGIALGNIGGRAAETVKHPTLKDAAGRARRVPGPVPDMEAPGIPIPAGVEEVTLLGDADSDRFTVEAALERARVRFSAGVDWRRVRIVWPPDGRDFNDLL
ncbi:hypothetical protein J2X65_001663 [Ancylobacter sp. 3268]|uniref:DUF7146 domain-containing protein n=1 Tax=Ancylobacter sp. 3268 TaxID=2817752 RepID=UPI00285D66F7|nr:CHC2 zinc finger domain-containing protein [Ancylobacter sp. 3268]MDR6952308.1 hypothetical protein [Ancylobacter sp. 3268]